jgi:hypothetical protein
MLKQLYLFLELTILKLKYISLIPDLSLSHTPKLAHSHSHIIIIKP